MRLCRFGDERLGVVRGDKVHDVTAVLEELAVHRYPLPDHDPMIAAFETLRPRMEAAADAVSPAAMAGLSLLPPVASPRKIVAAPVNYVKHLEEAQADPQLHFDRQVETIHKAGLFLKATSSLIGGSHPVEIRHPDRRNDHEIELVAVIGRKADRVSRAEALSYVTGYAVGLDMTARGPEDRSMRKSIDTYSVVGPCMTTADEIADPQDLDMVLTVNGENRQKANTGDMVIDIAGLIEFASSFYTLMPGDLLFTGTPEGVGPVTAGDRIRAEISGVGILEVHVR